MPSAIPVGDGGGVVPDKIILVIGGIEDIDKVIGAWSCTVIVIGVDCTVRFTLILAMPQMGHVQMFAVSN